MLSPQVLAIGSESATLHAVNAAPPNNSYRLAESATGAEALARVQREPVPDLYSSRSAEMGTLHALQHLRSMWPDLAIIVLVALGNKPTGSLGHSSWEHKIT